jgi:hypothetical protein
MFFADNGKTVRTAGRFQLRPIAGSGGAALLTARVASGKEVACPVHARFVRMLEVLNQARTDSLAPQGWLSRRELARRMGEQSGYEVDDDTVSTYATELLRKLARVVETVSGGQRVMLIERRRKRGFRLADGAEIQFLSNFNKEFVR